MYARHTKTCAKLPFGRLLSQNVRGGRSLRQAVRLNERTKVKTQYAAVFPGSVENHMSMGFAWNALMLLVAGLSAYYVTRGHKEEVSSGTECPRCHGTGKEACFCTRWSDGDTSGCASCNYTGVTRCKACGGGGSAVPIRLAIRKDEPGMRDR